MPIIHPTNLTSHFPSVANKIFKIIILFIKKINNFDPVYYGYKSWVSGRRPISIRNLAKISNGMDKWVTMAHDGLRLG